MPHICSVRYGCGHAVVPSVERAKPGPLKNMKYDKDECRASCHLCKAKYAFKDLFFVANCQCDHYSSVCTTASELAGIIVVIVMETCGVSDDERPVLNRRLNVHDHKRQQLHTTAMLQGRGV